MSPLLLPFQLLLLMFAGWINRRQLDVIEYLQEENRVLKERFGGRRLRFTDVERRRLARKAQALGRKVLNELETLVTPDTLLRWYRELVASKWNYSHRRGPGRPRVTQTIVDLILKMALENPSWGYTRIRGALFNLGHQVGRGTIANILGNHGIEPAPERDAHTRWSTFLKAHLGLSGGDGLLERRSLHDQGSRRALHPILYGHRLPIRTRRRLRPTANVCEAVDIPRRVGSDASINSIIEITVYNRLMRWPASRIPLANRSNRVPIPPRSYRRAVK